MNRVLGRGAVRTRAVGWSCECVMSEARGREIFVWERGGTYSRFGLLKCKDTGHMQLFNKDWLEVALASDEGNQV